VFTTALAGALQAMPRAIFADIAARVVKEVTQRTNGRQVPHAEGALRAALDGPEIKVPTFDVVLDGGQLVLAGGALVGITPGSSFALFPGTSAALRAGGDAPLLRARVAQVAPGLALLVAEGAMPADLPGRMVAREEAHGFGNLKLGLAVGDPAALAVVQRLGFVAVDARGPFALTAGPAGMVLRGRGGTALAALPPAAAPEFGMRLASALEKVARVESWLNVVRPRPGLGLCVLNGDRASFDPAYCPTPPGRRTLKLETPALVSVINESNAPRHAYVFAVGQKYDVTLVLPGVAASMLVPALVKVGIPEPAAHMFMFYYAVLADVSPPTALAPFAASAICGGKPFSTMMQAWKYTLPAFLVPVMFCLTPEGMYLLMLTPDGKTLSSLGDWFGVLMVLLTSSYAMVGLVVGATGHAIRSTNAAERLMATLGGFLLLAADVRFDLAGAGLLTAALVMHWLRVRGQTAKPAGAG
jgi:hypothetical protein